MEQDLSAAPPNDNSNAGVTLKFLRRLREMVTSRDSNMSTSQVGDYFLKPWTRLDQSSLVDNIYLKYLNGHVPEVELNGFDCVSFNPTVYIVHNSSYNFVQVINSIETFVLANASGTSTMSTDETENIGIWMDIFSVSLWRKADIGMLTNWTIDRKALIEKMDLICVVFENYTKPIILSKTWCLFEIYICFTARKQISITTFYNINNNNTEALYSLLLSNFEYFLNGYINDITLSKSTTSVASEKSALLSLVNFSEQRLELIEEGK